MTAPRADGPRRWVLAAGVLTVVSLLPVVLATDEAPDHLGAGPVVLQPVPRPRSTDVPPGYLRLPAPEPAAPAEQDPAADRADDAVAAAEAAAADSTELAVAVLDRETGEVAGGARAGEPYRTASLSKVVVAVDVLDRRRTEGLAVGEGDLDLLRRALGPSDDAAMNELWARFDGAGAPARLTRSLGLVATTAPGQPGRWGEMLVPAVDTVRVWRHILDEMPAADRDLLVSAMDAAPAVARDGFDQAFGLLDPQIRGPGDTVAKQGWMCCFSGDYYLHSSGTVGPDQRYLVALLSRIPRGPGWQAARDEVTEVADAAVGALS